CRRLVATAPASFRPSRLDRRYPAWPRQDATARSNPSLRRCTMKYTNLGRTGVTVSRLCLGCMSYGSPSWRPWVLDEAASRPFFRRAIECGINFFDTADMYSLGASEEVTGRALKEFARLEECVVASK